MKPIVIGILTLALSMTAALAAEPSAPILREKCGEDIKKVCAGVKPGEGRIIQCMRQNEDKLSQACREAFNSLRRPVERPSAAPN